MASRRGVGWVFNWMTRRTAASYGLIGEAIMLLHEQRLGLDGRALFNAVAASRYLRVVLVALRPDLRDDDVALADLGARHRPRLQFGGRSRVGYIGDVLRCATRESAKVRRLLRCVGERKGPVGRVYDEVAVHLAEARTALEGAPAARSVLN